MKPIFIFILFVLTTRAAKSQGEFNNWFFGQSAGLTFNSANPATLNGSVMAVSEGTATVSDASGNLLFYSDGTRIWNKDHAVMLNGNFILGDPSTTQGCLIVPMPGNPTKYYLFTLTDQTKSGELRYSIIDMTLDAGKGGVVPNQKNVFVASELTEKLVSATASACGVWVITHSREEFFESRLITSSGLQNPVFSTVGSVHNTFAGTMKVSRDNSKIAVAVISGSLELFDFNNSSGVVSNGLTLPVNPGRSTYSACFSADSKKLYVGEGAISGSIDVYQYDLTNNAAASIIASKTLVSTVLTQLPYVDIQLGPDNKLYVSKVGMNCLDVIPNANQKAPQCGYVENGVCLGTGKNASLCLPNDIRIQNNVLQLNLGPDVVTCPNANYILTAPPGSPGILWSTGATSQSITVNTGGIYWLEVNNGICKVRDSIKVQFTGNIVDLGDDSSICAGNSLQMNPGNFTSYLWQDNSTASTYTASIPGLYWVQVTDICGVTSRDSIIITEKVYTIPGYPDRTRCYPDTVILRGPGNFVSYSWSPNYNINSTTGMDVSVAPDADTTYYLKAEKVPGCFAYDTVRVKVRDPRHVKIGPDTAICAGEFLKIDAGNTFNTYLWSNGKKTSFIEVDRRGLYWVQTTDENGCKTRDSINMDWKICETALWVPNAFTPNGDGKNDKLTIHSKGYFLRFEFRIFDRWGQLVYASVDPRKSWDGTYHGKELPTNTYVWSCTYELYGLTKKTEKGTVTLIR